MALWKDLGLRDHSGGDLGPLLMNSVHLMILLVTSFDHRANDGCNVKIRAYSGMVHEKHPRSVEEGTQEVKPCKCSRLPEQVADSVVWDKSWGRSPSQPTWLCHYERRSQDHSRLREECQMPVFRIRTATGRERYAATARCPQTSGVRKARAMKPAL